MNINIRFVDESEAEAASQVIHDSFLALASEDYEPEARQRFLTRSSPIGLAAEIRKSAVSVAAFDDHRMVGFLLMPNPSLIGVLFVHPDCLRQGIAGKLWEQARTSLAANFPAVETVELNATPYAVNFYRSIGFVPMTTEFFRDGHRATRMACWLPARGLGAEVVPTVAMGSLLPEP